MLFLATLDLKRIERCRPSKDRYTVTVSDNVIRCFDEYLESRRGDQISLCVLKYFVGRDDADAYRECVDNIKGLLINKTDILRA